MTNHSMEIKNAFDEFEGKEVSLAGRMMSKRVMGKASFCSIQDLQGSIQAYVARDNLGEESYKDFKKLDIGDIIGIKGAKCFKTKTGEISIHATEVTLLSKSLNPLPEKFHGLDKHRSPLPSEICGSDHERRCKGYLHQTFQDPGKYP